MKCLFEEEQTEELKSQALSRAVHRRMVMNRWFLLVVLAVLIYLSAHFLDQLATWLATSKML